MNNRFDVIGIKVSKVNMNSSLEFLSKNFDKARNNYICVSNVHTTVIAYEDEQYKQIQNNSFMTLPDGKPLSIIGKLQKEKDVDRVTGPDFLENILLDNRYKDYSHYFYGNTKENLDIFIKYIKEKYPNTKICGYKPSVFRELNEKERNELKDEIIKAKTDFVWVALGAPKQEKFCEAMCKGTNAVWIGVGGAFNVIAGIIPRAPKILQNFSLEWLYRLMKEPKRLFSRYVKTNSKFIYYYLKSLFNEKV